MQNLYITAAFKRPCNGKYNQKNKIFNLQYDPCGPGQLDDILKFVQVTEWKIEKLTKLSKKLKCVFKPKQWENFLNCLLNKNVTGPDELMNIQASRHKMDFLQS